MTECPWQPIATMPKDGRTVLLWDGEQPVVAHWVVNPHTEAKGWLYVHQYDYEGGEATHWQPMLKGPHS